MIIKKDKSFIENIKYKIGNMEVYRACKLFIAIVMLCVIISFIVVLPKLAGNLLGVNNLPRNISLVGNIVECKDESEGLNKLFGIHVYTVKINVDNVIYTCKDEDSYYKCKNINSEDIVNIDCTVSSEDETYLKSIEAID